MKNPWTSLKQFLDNMDLEGRAKFDNLPTEEARNTATVYQALTMAALCASCLMTIYFLMYAVLILCVPEQRGDIHVWLRALNYAFWFGWVQGGFLGANIGFSQAKFWQGDRRKAGSNCAIEGTIIIAATAYVFLRYYDTELTFLINLFSWFLACGPGFLIACGMVAWGIKVLKE